MGLIKISCLIIFLLSAYIWNESGKISNEKLGRKIQGVAGAILVFVVIIFAIAYGITTD